MKYEDCKPVESWAATVWLIKFEDGSKELEVWHRKALITDVQEAVKNHNPNKNFTIMRIDVGRFLIHDDKLNIYASGDGRMLDQSLNMKI